NWSDRPTYVKGAPAVGADQKAGWGFQILPYIEATNVWTAGAKTAVATPQPVFFCPSRRSPQTIKSDKDAYDPPITGGHVTHALCDYAASNDDQTGVVRRYKPNRLAHVTDGTSSTLLAADKRMNLTYLGKAQDDDNEGYTVGWNSDTLRRTNRRPKPDFNGEGDGDHRFGASHGTVFNAVFVDGSVHTIVYSIDKNIFRYLGNISDGQTVKTDHIH
ncbi:MAG: DUF1559 domain-containing protein, partial [Pirellulales bacterium]